MTPDGNLYVVFLYLGCDPKLEVWPLLKETDASYLVKLRGGTKVFKKGVAGRKYFLTKRGAVGYLRAVYLKESSRAMQTVKRAGVILGKLTDAEVVKYARGDEKIALTVDKEVHATTP